MIIIYFDNACIGVNLASLFITMGTDDYITKEGNHMTVSALFTETFNIYCKEVGLLIPQDRCTNYQLEQGQGCFWCGYYSSELLR